jgi:hypothetical protein
MLSRSRSSCILVEVPESLSTGVDMACMPSVASMFSIEMPPSSVTGNVVSIMEDEPHHGSALSVSELFPAPV